MLDGLNRFHYSNYRGHCAPHTRAQRPPRALALALTGRFHHPMSCFVKPRTSSGVQSTPKVPRCRLTLFQNRLDKLRRLKTAVIHCIVSNDGGNQYKMPHRIDKYTPGRALVNGPR